MKQNKTTKVLQQQRCNVSIIHKQTRRAVRLTTLGLGVSPLDDDTVECALTRVRRERRAVVRMSVRADVTLAVVDVLVHWDQFITQEKRA